MRRILLPAAILLALLALRAPLAADAAQPTEALYKGTAIPVLGFDGVSESDDRYACEVPIGFAFSFYGQPYSQACVSNNGFITFDSGIATTGLPAAHPSPWTNLRLDQPDIALRDGGVPPEIYTMVVAFWDDLISRSDAQYVLYATIGEAPNREFVLQWTNYGFYEGTAPMGTFQLILYEGSDAIRFQYRQVMWTRATGNSAGIGVRNYPTGYTQYWQMGADDASDDDLANYSDVTGPITPWRSILWSWDGTGYTFDDDAAYEGILLYRTTPPPLALDLLGPPKGSTVAVRPTFAWEPTDPAATYRLQVATDPSLVNLVVDETLTATSYTPAADLALRTRYYWAVTALGDWGEVWSEERTFITGESTTTSLSYSPTLALAGETVTLTAAVSSAAGTPTGSVTFLDGDVALGTVALSGGSSSLATAGLAQGIHTITAAYSGDPDFAMGSDSVSLPIEGFVSVYSHDFAAESGPGWSAGGVSTPPCGGTPFLGEFGAEAVTLTLDSLPVHSYLTVSFDLLILRSWDGNQVQWPAEIALPAGMVAPLRVIGPDVWRLRAGGADLMEATFTNWPHFSQSFPAAVGTDQPAQAGARSRNSLCYTFGPYRQDATYPITLTFAHSGDSLTLEFSATGLSELADESWGLDNVKVLAAGRTSWQPRQRYLPLARGG